jgi:hypothetical protein
VFPDSPAPVPGGALLPISVYLSVHAQVWFASFHRKAQRNPGKTTKQGRSLCRSNSRLAANGTFAVAIVSCYARVRRKRLRLSRSQKPTKHVEHRPDALRGPATADPSNGTLLRLTDHTDPTMQILRLCAVA